MKSFILKNLLPPLMTLVLLLILIEGLCQKQILPHFLVPAPSEIFLTLQKESSLLGSALVSTIVSSLGGLVLTILVGLFLGGLSYFVPFFGRILTPYTIFFQTVPIVALAPMLVIWLGFGVKSVMASSFIVSLFPMISGAHLGFKSVEKNYLDLFSVYQANFKERFRKLLLPSSLPYLFQALKVSAGLSVIGAIVGEFMSGTGLGSVIEVARVQYRIDLMFAAILLTSLYGLTLLLLSNFMSYYFLKNWHASERL